MNGFDHPCAPVAPQRFTFDRYDEQSRVAAAYLARKADMTRRQRRTLAAITFAAVMGLALGYIAGSATPPVCEVAADA